MHTSSLIYDVVSNSVSSQLHFRMRDCSLLHFPILSHRRTATGWPATGQQAAQLAPPPAFLPYSEFRQPQARQSSKNG